MTKSIDAANNYLSYSTLHYGLTVRTLLLDQHAYFSDSKMSTISAVKSYERKELLIAILLELHLFEMSNVTSNDLCTIS